MMLGVFALSSCDSDRDDNPTLTVPSSFTLLQPTIGSAPLDLESSTSLALVAENQPAYGFPTQVTYTAQMSMTNNFTDSTQFYTFDASTTSTTLDVPTSEIDLGIMNLKDYTDASEVNTDSAQVVYLRMKANLANATSEATAVYSNVQQVNVYPYYIERTAAAPDYWFMTGGSILDGSWTNGKDAAAYLAQFPLSEVKDGTYDSKTGKGDFESIIYLPADGSIKLKHYVDSWNYQWGMNDGTLVENDGGSGNIVPTDGAGFYTIHYNNASNSLTFAKSEKQDYTTYSSISIIGIGGDWNTDIDMTTGASNHLWAAHLTVTETTNFKFRANHAWDTNWGYGTEDGEVNLKGFGVGGGKNIGIEPGDYVIYLNDIDGFFRIVPIGEKTMPDGATE